MRQGKVASWGRALGSAFGLLCLTLLLLAAPATADFDCGTPLSRCQVQLDNSGRAWFSTTEKLTEDALGDGTLKNGVFQVYERAGNRTRLISKGPDGKAIEPDSHHVAAALDGVSPDGERVYISTAASLTPEDTDVGGEDGSVDGYELSNGNFRLLTTGPLDEPSTGPFANNGSYILWASDDGKYVYFTTSRRLTPDDWDSFPDIYQLADGRVRLVSTGPDETLPTAEFPNPFIPDIRFLGASPDGATAYFSTAAHLTPDEPAKSAGETRFLTSDIFSWRDGVTKRITHTVSPEEVPGTPWESFDPYSFAAADDGSVYFAANSSQVPEDTDLNRDIYRARPDGSLERVISSPPSEASTSLPNEVKGFLRVEGVSHDGSRLFLSSSQQLAPQDHDHEVDVYMWSNGKYQLVTPEGDLGKGTEEELQLCSISSDGQRAYFHTWASLSPQDTDEEPDVYEWSNGKVRLVSPASDGRQSAAFCSGISPNGRFVAFSTWEELVPGDNDTKQDIYVIDMGAANQSGASASLARPGGRRPKKRRLRLITAESIPPKMDIGKAGSFDGRVAHLRLRCPKQERSGPCHGTAKLLSRSTGDVLGAGSFRIAPGHSAKVAIGGSRLNGYKGSIKGLVARVRGADRLGNAATVLAKVSLSRTRKSHGS
jgi:Tol biopolymer transport system component